MRLAVIGAGEMGHGIAELAALHGHEVRMRDVKQEFLDRGMERIRWSLGKLVEKHQIRPDQMQQAFDRIHTTLDLAEACRNADVAIEAVFEDLDLKKRVFQELDAAAPKKTILASNTSALPITKMALVTKRPKQVVGMHFFNPPMLMPLIEVIRADTTSDATLGVAVDLSKSLGKTVVVVKKDVPGFITTRVLGPYFEEAARIHDEEGVPIETIDAAMRFRAGFPMGPFELADQVGIDVLHHLIENADRPMPRSVQALMDGKKLGRKVDEGFYAYKEGRPNLTPDMGLSFDPVRILSRMINEAAELVALNRPDRLNTIGPQVFDELERALAELERDDAIRCVVVTGAGDRSFSAGADLTSFSDISKAFKVWQFSRRGEEVMNRLANFSKPTLAAINGHCFGGGLELALACDFRIAAKGAKLGQTEVNLGLVPGAGGTQRLVRMLGQAKAKELVLLGLRLTSDEAAAIGLVTKTVENEAFSSEVREFAGRLARQAPIAIRLAKALLNRGGDTPIDAALEMEAMAFGLVASTDDIYEGIQAFMEKRAPKFKGT